MRKASLRLRPDASGRDFIKHILNEPCRLLLSHQGPCKDTEDMVNRLTHIAPSPSILPPALSRTRRPPPPAASARATFSRGTVPVAIWLHGFPPAATSGAEHRPWCTLQVWGVRLAATHSLTISVGGLDVSFTCQRTRERWRRARACVRPVEVAPVRVRAFVLTSVRVRVVSRGDPGGESTRGVVQALLHAERRRVYPMVSAPQLASRDFVRRAAASGAEDPHRTDTSLRACPAVGSANSQATAI